MNYGGAGAVLVVILPNDPIGASTDGRDLLPHSVPEVELLEGVVPVLVQEQWPPALELCGKND